jgi:hypothetical protein
MPTTRRRRSREREPYHPVVRALLAHEPVERTAQNRRELQQLLDCPFEGPGRQYPFLCGWAQIELEKWDSETH